MNFWPDELMHGRRAHRSPPSPTKQKGILEDAFLFTIKMHAGKSTSYNRGSFFGHISFYTYSIDHIAKMVGGILREPKMSLLKRPNLKTTPV